MASPISVMMILCDSAVADPAGKVHMLGAGWSITGSPTSPQAVALLMKIPWDRANQRIPLRISLLDQDGQPVMVTAEDGTKHPIEASGEVEVGRPPGLPHGSLLDASFVVNVPSLPLPPGRYEWRLDMDQQDHAVSFDVRAR